MTAVVAVDARDVRRTYEAREVLAGLDLEIEAGAFVALLGRSGSGKSTLLRALAGLDPHVGGTIRVPRRRAVVFQDARLLPWADVVTNVALGERHRGAVDRALSAIDEVGLSGRERDLPKTLSGGEAQRAALARALVRQPQLLLLDEPFASLDALTRIRMHALVRRLHARHRPTVLLVTHDVEECLLLADRVLVLDGGRIALDVVVDVPAPRDRGAAWFLELRARLLGALGVDDHEPDRSSPPPRTNLPLIPES